MAISVVQSSLKRDSAGSETKIQCYVLYTTYQTGGPLLPAIQFGLDQIRTVNIEQKGGFQLDARITTNGTGINFLAFSGGGGGSISRTTNEVVVVMANSGTLAAVPSLVQNVYVTAGGVTGPFLIIPSGVVPTTTQVAINLATGVLTFAAADAVTSATVTYTIPAVAAGASAEVANGTNLASLGNIQLEVIGK
jgi:hypothetical protein